MPRTAPIIDVQLLDHPVQPEPFDPFPQPAGGECCFLGRTRVEEHPQHGPLEQLIYEAYRPMAERVLRRMAESAAAQFDCPAVRIHHAIGPVAPGEVSVLVRVVAAHRHEAFAACRALIDQLKSEAPIWKREVWTGGQTWSEGTPVHCDEDDEP